MFKYPRENRHLPADRKLPPSTGRPPSPGPLLNLTATQFLPPQPKPKTAMAPSNQKSNWKSTTPAKPAPAKNGAVKPKQQRLAFGNAPKTPAKGGPGFSTGMGKKSGLQNGNIKAFFKKAEEKYEQGMFVGGSGAVIELDGDEEDGGVLGWEEDENDEVDVREKVEEGVKEVKEGEGKEGEHGRYNESGGSVKKRRLFGSFTGSFSGSFDAISKEQDAVVALKNGGKACTPSPPAEDEELFGVNTEATPIVKNEAEREGVGKSADQPGEEISTELPMKPVKTQRKVGPFVEDSDSDDDQPLPKFRSFSSAANSPITTPPYLPQLDGACDPIENEPEGVTEKGVQNDLEPIVNQEPPSLKREGTSFAQEDGFDEFGDDDFDEELLEGEETIERKWMEEQRALEMGEEDIENSDVDEASTTPSRDATSGAACPICNESLDGIADQEASIHVNNCLDGNPSPIRRPPAGSTTVFNRSENSVSIKRVPKFVRPPKPGQENPFVLGETKPKASSAFSKLMATHAEDAAWATAAAAEHAARGKPAYQRTCPFYKILPGFYICVDAFRYGAVEGCQAYFLSHFHSDHYIGLTSSWRHGPIYCSKVTANLVRQQLRVDAQYVVPLEFEKKVEVPGTKGVFVTMIPANHCPGSSLYLFEKTVGTGPTPKVQRVLHCGDFRACRAHVEHPLLRPDVMDAVTGQTRQQKIDVCYLDTTYLNPKYAFPSQEEVISACSDMCVSLNKVRPDESDAWETMKRERAGSGMVKFVQKDPTIKQEDPDDSASIPDKPRGPLLVVVGTYSIGKERVCLGIARALNSKIYAPPNKQKICTSLEDAELSARLTDDPRKAQVHMTALFEIRPETLDDYLKDYRDTFTRCVGFRPSGWNYRPPNSRFTESPSVQTVLHSPSWQSNYSMRDLVPQRGSTNRAKCFGVPYSEHSSFRELTMFCCALRIEKVIPTVNVGSAKSREKMRSWIERWMVERRKNGIFKPEGKWGDEVLRGSISA